MHLVHACTRQMYFIVWSTLSFHVLTYKTAYDSHKRWLCISIRHKEINKRWEGWFVVVSNNLFLEERYRSMAAYISWLFQLSLLHALPLGLFSHRFPYSCAGCSLYCKFPSMVYTSEKHSKSHYKHRNSNSRRGWTRLQDSVKSTSQISPGISPLS